jgi:hypothetical protein
MRPMAASASRPCLLLVTALLPLLLCPASRASTHEGLLAAAVPAKARPRKAPAPPPATQTPAAKYSLEAGLGLGYTFTDIDGWSGGYASDWSQFAWRANAAVFLGLGRRARIGAEVGHDYFLWYTVATGYGYQSEAREATAWHVMAVGRLYFSPRMFAELGGGYYFFSADFSDPGIVAGLGYQLPVGGRFSVPIKARVGAILDKDTKLLPLTLSGGIALDF